MVFHKKFDFIRLITQNNLAKDSFWALLGSVIGQGLSLIAGIFVARILGKELYGAYGIVKTTLVQITIFSSFGLGYTLTRFVAQRKNEAEEQNSIRGLVSFAMNVTLIVSAFISFLVFVFAKQIAIWLDYPSLYVMLRISSVAVIFNAINSTQVGAMSGFKDFKQVSINRIYTGIVTLVLSVCLANWFGLIGAVVALALSFVFNSLINRFSIEKRLNSIQQTGRLSLASKKALLLFSLPVALQESSYSVIHWVNTFVIIKLAGYGELGLYNAAAQWGAIMIFLPGVLRNVMLSYFSGTVKDKSEHSRIVNYMLVANLGVTLGLIVLIIVFSGIISSFYGPTFDNLRGVLIIVVASSLFEAASQVFQQEFIAIGRNWFLFFVRFIRDIAVIGLVAYILISTDYQGAYVVALVSLLGSVLYSLVLFIAYKSSLK